MNGNTAMSTRLFYILASHLGDQSAITIIDAPIERHGADELAAGIEELVPTYLDVIAGDCTAAINNCSVRTHDGVLQC